MDFFKKMFTAKEVKKVLTALDAVESEFDNFPIEFPMVKEWVEQTILNDQKNIIHFIDEKKISPTNMVYLLMADITGNYLGTGDYHIRTGVLNPLGEVLFDIYHIVTERLVTGGYLSREAADKDIAQVCRNIKGVG